MESSINLSRKIGVELECVLPIIGSAASQNFDVQELVASVLTAQGLPAYPRGYSHEPVPSGHLFAVEHDSSLRDESRYAGIRWAKVELKTAPMTWEQLERSLPPALEILRYLGARCNASTGYHVHHHLPEIQERPEIARNLWHLWWRFHRTLYGCLPPSRRNSQYCRPPRQQDARRYDRITSYPALCRELSRVDRYEGLNLKNLAERGRLTVEWRLHSGTLEWEKVSAWVLATQRWVEHAVARSCHYRSEPVANTREGLNALFVTTGLKTNSRIYPIVEKPLRQAAKYLLRRWRHFNIPQSKAAAIAA